MMEDKIYLNNMSQEEFEFLTKEGDLYLLYSNSSLTFEKEEELSKQEAKEVL